MGTAHRTHTCLSGKTFQNFLTNSSSDNRWKALPKTQRGKRRERKGCHGLDRPSISSRCWRVETPYAGELSGLLTIGPAGKNRTPSVSNLSRRRTQSTTLQRRFLICLRCPLSQNKQDPSALVPTHTLCHGLLPGAVLLALGALAGRWRRCRCRHWCFFLRSGRWRCLHLNIHRRVAAAAVLLLVCRLDQLDGLVHFHLCYLGGHYGAIVGCGDGGRRKAGNATGL